MSETSDSVDIEREYSPSMWTLRFPTRQEVMRHHIQFVTASSEVATNNIPHKLEVEYGSTPGQKLDILGTDLPDDAPIFVYIHGGYWQELSREVSRYAARPLYRSRIKTIVVGYDLCPAVTLADIVNQIQNAAIFVFEYAEKLGSSGVYFAGHSAGAHLTAKALASANLFNAPGSCRLQGAFLISGVYDLQELVHTSINEAVKITQESAVSLSPQFDSYTHLQGKGMRIYIVVGQHESPRFKTQSRKFYELLCKDYSTEHVYWELKDNVDHFDIVECFANDNNYLKSLLLDDIRQKL